MDVNVTISHDKSHRRIVVLSILAVFLFAVCITLGIFLLLEHSKYSALCNAFDTQSEDISSMRAKINTLESSISNFERKLSDAKAQSAKLEVQNSELQSSLSFWDTSAVIVTTTGSSYHKYDCSHISGSPFNIFNLENAKAKGYAPCLDCKPPLESGQAQIKSRFGDESPPKSKYAPSAESSNASSRNGILSPEEAVKALGIDPAPTPTQWRSTASSFFNK